MTRMTLPDCIGLATWAHRNQLDKAGFPYIEHPLAVLKLTQERGLPPFVQMAAVFHDTTEDTLFTVSMLRDLGLTPPAADLVDLMDRHASEERFIDETGLLKPDHRKHNELYRTWKRKRDIYYYTKLREHEHGKALKDCDMAHNRLPWRTSYLSPQEREYGREKYAFADAVLTGEITE